MRWDEPTHLPALAVPRNVMLDSDVREISQNCVVAEADDMMKLFLSAAQGSCERTQHLPQHDFRASFDHGTNCRRHRGVFCGQPGEGDGCWTIDSQDRSATFPRGKAKPDPTFRHLAMGFACNRLPLERNIRADKLAEPQTRAF